MGRDRGKTMHTLRRETSHDLPFLAWKIQAPRLDSRLLARPRLVARIEAALGRRAPSGDVFLVAAPAGYGKSTLIAQWAAESAVPVAWYHLDAGDDDPVTLIQGLVKALKARLPRSTWQVESLLARLRPGALSALDLRRAAAILIQDIRANVGRPLALALTGLSELRASSDGHKLLNHLLARQPDHLRLLLEARDYPRLRLSTLVTQHRLSGLGMDDLRLDDDEFDALLELTGAALASAARESLRGLCGGWMTGVLLATGALLPEFLHAGDAAELDSERVFDYLAVEVIDALDPALRDFATEAAVLGYMTASLCANLLELSSAQAQLVALEQHTGFVTRVGRRPEEPVYRFQPLLRQALLARLEATSGGPGRRRMLHLRAGLLLEALGDAEEAIQQYLLAGAQDRILSLIEAQRGALLRVGRGATLERWLDLLPSDVRAREPELLVLLAELRRQAGQGDEARAAAEHAWATAQLFAMERPELQARALLLRAQLRVTHAEYALARRDCADVLTLAPVEAVELRIQALCVQARCVEVEAGASAALECLRRVDAVGGPRPDPWLVAHVHYQRSGLYLRQGEYGAAETAAHTALLHAQEANDEVGAINCRLNLGAIKSLTRHYASAREQFEMARAQAEQAGYASGCAYALANLADLDLELGQCEHAADVYERAIRAAVEADDEYLRASAYAGLGCTLTATGQARAAVERLRPELEARGARGQDADWVKIAISLGFALHRSGETERASELLLRARERAGALGLALELAQAGAHLAAAELARGRTQPATEALTAALDATQATERLGSLLIVARHLPELRPLLDALRPRHPLAAELLDALRAPASGEDARMATVAAHTDAPESADDEDATIRVFALGESRVYVGTRQITRWRMPHARELLFFLLDKGEPVTRDTILSTFWPHRNPEESANTFRQARFQLKQALGRECLTQQNGRWRLTVDVWVDAREFEQLVDAGERLAAAGRLGDSAATLTRALGLWHGPYLEDCTGDWAYWRRDGLQRRYLSCLDLLADVEARLERHDAAMQHYYQMLELEPHRESAHRGLMRQFAHRGELAEALHQFARCFNALKHDLGVTPSRETIDLYRALRSQYNVRSSAGAAPALSGV